MFNIKNYIGFLVLVVTFSCCNKNDPDDQDSEFDRKALLSNYSKEIIVPGYQSFSDQIAELNNATDNFVNTADEANLISLRENWQASLIEWQNVSVFEMGPAADMLLRENLNLYPTDTTLILGNISGGTYDLASVSNYAAKGFQAMDYLLYEVGNTNTEVLAWYNADNNRKQYLADIVDDIKFYSDSVNNQWSTYQGTFNSSDGTDVGSSTGMLINALNKYWEVYVRDGKIGIPAGARSFSGTPLPEKVEAYYYGNFSVDLCIKAVERMQGLYLGTTSTGTNGKGLDDYLVFLEHKTLNDDIKAQFTVVLTKLNGLTDPLSGEVVNNQDKVLEVFNEMQKLAVLLKVDLPAALGVLITYSDSDGD